MPSTTRHCIVPRRAHVDLLTSPELAIREAILAVERMAPDVRLTEAVILLGQAKAKVADFVDERLARLTSKEEINCHTPIYLEKMKAGIVAQVEVVPLHNWVFFFSGNGAYPYLGLLEECCTKHENCVVVSADYALWHLPHGTLVWPTGDSLNGGGPFGNRANTEAARNAAIAYAKVNK